jgi:hypothetical protein
MTNSSKAKRLSEMLDRMEEKVRKINPDISLDRSTYIKQKDLCRWIDSKVGEFYRTPNSVINGSAFHPDTLQDRKKATSLAKFGTENPAQSEEIIRKIKETICKKYGEGGHMKNSDVVNRYKDTMNERYGVDYPAQNQTILKKQWSTNLERYGHRSSLGNSDVVQKVRDTNLERHGFSFPVQNIEIKEKMQKTNLEKYGTRYPILNPDVMKKIKETNIERFGMEYAVASPPVRAKIEKSHIERTGFKNSLQNPAIREAIKKTMLSRYGSEHPGGSHAIQQKIHQKQKNTGPEVYVKKFLVNAGIDVRDQVFLNGKMWDLGIFKNNQLDLIIEIDGEFHHSLISDPYSLKNQFVPDDTRYSRLPENVKFLAIDSQKVKKSFPEISRLLNMDCSDQVNEIVTSLTGSPFPFPAYDSKRMAKDWTNLCKMKPIDKFNNKLMPANSLVTNFHKSIYFSKVGKNPSPAEAWSDKKLLKKCIENRFLYASSLSSQTIARGFERSKIAPRVTVFQPYLARWLLQTYTPEAKIVTDPFSGFSGRMLGAASLGMHYYGSDIRCEVIEESQKISDFLKLENIFLSQVSSEAAVLPDADTLLTCPPYGNKEVWFHGQDCMSADDYIDQCLSRFKAKTYIFVIDKTVKYNDFIRLSIDRTSHISSSSKELVVVIEPCEKKN